VPRNAAGLGAFAAEARSLGGSIEKLSTGNKNMTNQNIAFHLPADTGPSYTGPGDRYTFLATGAQTNGAYFMMEAIIPPGGGPPPHIHHREEEGFYLLEGTLDITLAEKKLEATTGDFVQIPRGTVHAFRNAGSTTARMLLFFSPAGMEKYVEEVLEPFQNRSAAIPAVTDALISRMVGAGPKYGIQFV
jgi:quercetin dioxygenase-like cupin family protein